MHWELHRASRQGGGASWETSVPVRARLDEAWTGGALSMLGIFPTLERTNWPTSRGRLSLWSTVREKNHCCAWCGQIILFTLTFPSSRMGNIFLLGRLLPNDTCLLSFTATYLETNLHFSLSESHWGAASSGSGWCTKPHTSPTNTHTLPTLWFGASHLTTLP